MNYNIYRNLHYLQILLTNSGCPVYYWYFLVIGYLTVSFGVSLDGFHKSLNSMKSPEDSRISIGDILGDILRNYLQDNLREVSGNLRTSGDL